MNKFSNFSVAAAAVLFAGTSAQSAPIMTMTIHHAAGTETQCTDNSTVFGALSRQVHVRSRPAADSLPLVPPSPVMAISSLSRLRASVPRLKRNPNFGLITLRPPQWLAR